MAEDEWVTGNVSLKIGGYPLDMEMTVPANPIKPHRMLPIFHQMANSFADIGVQSVESEGRSISCKAGCAACCRQPVPLAEIEIYQIAELVESMPEPRRAVVKKRFADAVEHFRTIGWFDDFKKQYDGGRPKTSAKQMKQALSVVHRYFAERIDCPFLENELCSIHQSRPMSCREYLVTSAPENCAKLSGEGMRMVALPIKPSRTVEQLAHSGVRSKEGIPVLIMALEFAEAHPEKFPEKTGEQWMADFFGRLTADANTEKEPLEPSLNSAHKKRKRH